MAIDSDFAQAGFVDVAPAAKSKKEPVDKIGRDLQEALSRYLAGQYKASIACSADAINALAIREKIHGAASY